MNIKFFFNILIIISVFCINSAIFYCQSIDSIESKSYILIDSKSGQILVEKNADEKLYPASTTKMMTAIIALENGQLDKKITASQNAVNSVGPGGMNIGITQGEEICVEELLNALLVRSANETAYILAENIGTNYSNFIDLMNKKAVDIGAKNTHFVNPCGMDTQKCQRDHLSTARDLALIARYGMQLPKFREIVGKKSCTVSATNKHPEKVTLYTTNKLFYHTPANGLNYHITGIKTGYTDRAGHNLVSSAINNDGIELIAVVLDVKSNNPDNIFYYSKQLLEYGFQNYSLHRIIDGNKVIKKVPVVSSKDNSFLDIVTKEALKVVLPNNSDLKNIKTLEYINPKIEAPVTQGQVLGHIDCISNDIKIGSIDLIASRNVERITIIGLILKIFTYLYVIIIILIILRIILKYVSRKRVYKKRGLKSYESF